MAEEEGTEESSDGMEQVEGRGGLPILTVNHIFRDVGASQGCSLQFGVDGQVTNYRMFEGASTYGQCSCCRHEAVLLLCRGTQDNIV